MHDEGRFSIAMPRADASGGWVGQLGSAQRKAVKPVKAVKPNLRTALAAFTGFR